MRKLKTSFTLTFIILVFAHSWSQEEEVTITVDTLSNEVYMLTGQGGNIGIYVGPNKVYMISLQD